MYGTVARMRVKPGAAAQLEGQLQEYATLRVPGFVATYIYHTDADPDVQFMAVIFASKDAYQTNAESPEQDARYQRMRALLADDPEWHDGEIVAVTGA
jgi:quinol monooxygenase YgiN